MDQEFITGYHYWRQSLILGTESDPESLLDVHINILTGTFPSGRPFQIRFYAHHPLWYNLNSKIKEEVTIRTKILKSEYVNYLLNEVGGYAKDAGGDGSSCYPAFNFEPETAYKFPEYDCPLFRAFLFDQNLFRFIAKKINNK